VSALLKPRPDRRPKSRPKCISHHHSASCSSTSYIQINSLQCTRPKPSKCTFITASPSCINPAAVPMFDDFLSLTIIRAAAHRAERLPKRGAARRSDDAWWVTQHRNSTHGPQPPPPTTSPSPSTPARLRHATFTSPPILAWKQNESPQHTCTHLPAVSSETPWGTCPPSRASSFAPAPPCDASAPRRGA
jgi:hypothetical protein